MVVTSIRTASTELSDSPASRIADAAVCSAIPILSLVAIILPYLGSSGLTSKRPDLYAGGSCRISSGKVLLWSASHLEFAWTKTYDSACKPPVFKDGISA
jgi:hypothetical protein